MSHSVVPGNFPKQTAPVSASKVIKMIDQEISVPSLKIVSYKEVLLDKFHSTSKLSVAVPLDYSSARLVKRIIDIIISFLVILFLLSWLLPVISLLIKLTSKGPVFFLQKRSGRYNKLFTCIKFRSMVVNPQADLKAAIENDERITRFGKFLRNYHLDELPQFFNVLSGDMSVIGPRPHMISDDLRYEEQIRHYDFRRRIKPGITGLAQVLGYSGLADDIQKMKNRVQLDFFYIRHWSLRLDALIMFRTFWKASCIPLLFTKQKS
jgi:putative colanic acid biosynthesis UDP-glucose lipid carrier transferase